MSEQEGQVAEEQTQDSLAGSILQDMENSMQETPTMDDAVFAEKKEDKPETKDEVKPKDAEKEEKPKEEEQKEEDTSLEDALGLNLKKEPVEKEPDSLVDDMPENPKAADWKAKTEKHNAVVADMQRQLEEKAAALTKLHSRFEDPAKIEDMLKRFDGMESREKMFNLRGTDEYRNKVGAPRQNAENIFNAITKEYGLDVNITSLSKLGLRDFDKAFDKLTEDSEMGMRSKAQLADAITAYQTIDQVEKDLESNSSELLEQYSQNAEDRTRKASEEVLNKHMDDAGFLLKEIPITDGMTEDQIKFNKDYNSVINIDAIRAGVEKNLFGESSDTGIAEQALGSYMWNQAVPKMVDGFQRFAIAQQEKFDAVKAELDSIKKAGHTMHGKSTSNQGKKSSNAELLDSVVGDMLDSMG